jgi:hypothetical protein
MRACVCVAPCSRVLMTSSGCSASTDVMPAVEPEMASRIQLPSGARPAPPSVDVTAMFLSRCAERAEQAGGGGRRRTHPVTLLPLLLPRRSPSAFPLDTLSEVCLAKRRARDDANVCQNVMVPSSKIECRSGNRRPDEGAPRVSEKHFKEWKFCPPSASTFARLISRCKCACVSERKACPCSSLP